VESLFPVENHGGNPLTGTPLALRL